MSTTPETSGSLTVVIWGFILAIGSVLGTLLGKKIWLSVGKGFEKFYSLPDRMEAAQEKFEKAIMKHFEDVWNEFHLVRAQVDLLEKYVLHIPVLGLDADGRLVRTTDVALEMFGRSEEDCRGDGWWACIYAGEPGMSKSELRRQRDDSMSRGEPFDSMVRIRNFVTSKEETRRMRMLPIKIREAGGTSKVICWKVTFEDIKNDSLKGE